MADIMTIIKERRSVRNYEIRDLEDEQLKTLLEAIKWSPSWANTQCWEVIVVKDSNIKKMLQQTLPKNNPAYKAIAEASIVIAMCAKLGKSGFYKGSYVTKFDDWFMFDIGIATQSLCLAAYFLGLGTVIVGLFDHDKAKSILQVPSGHEVVVLIPVGYPKKLPSAPKRKNIEEFTHYDVF